MDDDCSATRKGSRVVGVGRYTSVTAMRMTDAYGVSTHKGCYPIPQGHAILSDGSLAACRGWYICCSPRLSELGGVL